MPMPLSRATVDGWVFPASIYEVFAAGDQMDIPVIVGSNADEGTMFTPPGVAPEVPPRRFTDYLALQFCFLLMV